MFTRAMVVPMADCPPFVRKLPPNGLCSELLSGEKWLEKPRRFSKVWYSVCLLCALLSRGSLVRIQHGSPFASPSSSLAQDIGLSRRQHGFKSRRGRQKIFFGNAVRFNGNPG